MSRRPWRRQPAGARPVEALQAPTSQVEIGLPVTSQAVTGKAATGPNGNPTRTGPRERARARSNQDRKELRSGSSATSQPNGQLDQNEHKAHAAVQPRTMECGTEWSDSTLEPANYRSTNRLQAYPARAGMDRFHLETVMLPAGLPRTRGDLPTPFDHRPRTRISVHPARAGVYPGLSMYSHISPGSPRTRGGLPGNGGFHSADAPVTPHARGSTSSRSAGRPPRTGHPARAGVYP